ncbi:tetraspanin-8-like [Pecten maximus]|uniref:tetraspanin-8-like n=1 Tax=Pecten maximus TaxID=6579 RepID=UPI00145872EE|nr:tetraspanin-8-like [Pecten maximus]XP_033758754.1 tetraspanin-8-like [Pecten maximus]
MVAGCGANLAKVALVVVNVIFLLLGLAIAVAGLYFKFGEDILQDDIKNALDEINLDVVGGVDVYTLLDQMSNIFIAVGFIIFAIGFFGCCGACCQWRWMLVIYAIVVILLMIVQIAGIALFASFKGEINSSFSKEATKLLTDKYDRASADEDKKKITEGFNQLFKTFQCCGIHNYTDISSSTTNLPPECCPTTVTTSTVCPTNDANDGCFTKLDDLFSKYQTIFIAVGVCIIVFQLLCVIFSFCLCTAISREGAV